MSFYFACIFFLCILVPILLTSIVHLLLVVSSWLFFFFKQKTAYEMRISDWSSDVCSSDLSCVYLLALRHPTPVAKQVATLDHLTEGRFVFGVGVGGEFPGEFAASGIPHKERGARVNEGIEVVRKLWTDRKSTRLNSSH